MNTHQVYEDAFLLDTEQWEWTRVAPSQAQQLQRQQQDDKEQEQEQEQPGLLGGGPLVPAPGFLVGHTAVLASSAKGDEEEGEAQAQGEGAREAKGGQGARVLVFGGQDRFGVRREELLVLKG